MVLTRKKTEVAEETREGFSTKPVAKSYFAPVFEADQDQDPIFEVEKEYNDFEVLKDQKRSSVLPEFDVLQNGETTAKAESLEKRDVQMRLSTRGKILAIVGSLVMVLLLTMVIYNAVILGAKTKEVSLLASQVATKQEEVSLLEQMLASSESEESVNSFLAENASSLRKATQSDKVIVSYESVETQQISAPTNWFDKLCEFLSSLFE